uniref:Putative secreted protein n=1 Tax=Anopheles darlingi TaxID=43151 RepID=A0A2M4DH50_ANODA
MPAPNVAHLFLFLCKYTSFMISLFGPACGTDRPTDSILLKGISWYNHTQAGTTAGLTRTIVSSFITAISF